MPPYPKTRLCPYCDTHTPPQPAPGHHRCPAAGHSSSPSVCHGVCAACTPIARAKAAVTRAPAAAPRALLVPFHTVKPCYILSRVRLRGGERRAGRGGLSLRQSGARNHRELGLLSKKPDLQRFIYPALGKQIKPEILASVHDIKPAPRAQLLPRRGDMQAEGCPTAPHHTPAPRGAQRPPWMSSGRSCCSPSARKMLMALCSMWTPKRRRRSAGHLAATP